MKTPERFHTNLVLLVEFIIQLITDDKKSLNPILMEANNDKIRSWDYQKKEKAIEHFIVSSMGLWSTLIAMKDDTFFVLHGRKVFPYLDRVNFTDLFPGPKAKTATLSSDDSQIKSSKISKEDRDLLWKYIIIFVRQGIKHIHESRGPRFEINKHHVYGPVYKSKYLETIDIRKYAKEYSVKLEWNP